jgi:hypothetical protein
MEGISEMQWVDIVNKLGTMAIAGIGAVYAYWQYRQAQIWKRSDLAATLVAQFDADEELAFACRALDWGIGPLIVPARYQPLQIDVDESQRAIMQHDTAIMYDAMRPNLQESTLKDPRGLIYRYCFDKLLSHLDHINQLVERRQLDINDLDATRYWLERLARYEYPPHGHDTADVFQPFIKAVGYTGVAALGRKLGVPGFIN